MLHQLLLVELNTHILDYGLKTQSSYDFSLVHCHSELLLQLKQLRLSIQLIQRNVLGSIHSSILSHLLNGFLQDCCGVLKSYLIKRRKNVWICEVFFPFNFYRSRVLNLRIYSSLGGVIYPLTYKDFIFFTEKVGPLTFSFVVDPVAFKMISTPLGEHAVSASFSHVPHPFVDVSVGVDHSSLTMWQVVHPHSIISISSFVKHSASALFGVIFPIAGVLPSEFVFGICDPVGSLAVAFIFVPSAFILVSVGVVLYAESFLFIVLPIAHILV